MYKKYLKIFTKIFILAICLLSANYYSNGKNNFNYQASKIYETIEFASKNMMNEYKIGNEDIISTLKYKGTHYFVVAKKQIQKLKYFL